MQSNTPPSSPPTSPPSSSRWKRARPVPARYGSTKSTNRSPIQLSLHSIPQATHAHETALKGSLGQIRHVLIPQRILSSDEADNEISDGERLQHMQLEDSLRLLRFTPTPRLEEQYTASTATNSSIVPRIDGPSHSTSHGSINDIDGVRKGEVYKEEQGHGSGQGIEQQKSMKANSISQDADTSGQFSGSEFVPSQEGESSAIEPLEDEIESEEEEPEEEPEEHIDLDYQIPEEILRTAMLAPPNTRASFWNAKMYRGPDGQSPATHYCRTKEVAERVAQYFLKEKVLGFDIEWKPYGNMNSIKQNASLIQLACEDRIALFHIALFPGATPKELMPPTLKKILESPDIYKVGVSVKGDFTRLRKYLGIEAQGVFELSRLHNLVEWHARDPKKVTNRLAALALQVLQHLQLPLYKGAQLDDDPTDTANVRASDWSKPLDPQQIQYAASDTYAGFRLYHILEWKRKQLRPTPPTRGICDYDAKPVPKSPKARKKSTTKSKDVSKSAPEQSASEADSEPESEQQQELLEEEEGDEEQTYETAPEDSIDSHELEDSMSTSVNNIEQVMRSHSNQASDATHRHKCVGRVNLSWLKGPDPCYPILPQEPDDYDTPAASSHYLVESVNNIDGIQNTAHSSHSRLDELEMDDDDEFADPELESALQVLDLDVDGKLTDHSEAIVTVRRSQGNGHAESGPNHTDPSPKLQGTYTPEFCSATLWAQNYLQSTIPSPNSIATSRIRATIPHLRSYHLWYHQSLSLEEIAGHLRDPPLLQSTVAGYVLQAVTLERLDYDNHKMRDMMMGLPAGLRQGRWKGMAEKVGAFK
jgi:ribonuclease D